MRLLRFRRSRGGFTLLELLIALGLAAMIAVGVAAVLSLISGGFARSTAATRRDRLRSALSERCIDELEAAYAVAGRPDTAMRIGPDPDHPERGSRIAWTLIRRIDAGPAGVVDAPRRVAWGVARVPGRDGFCLVRMDRTAAGDSPGDTVPWDIVLDDVEAFRVEATADGTVWVDQWPPGDTDLLPRAVRLSVKAPALGPDPLDLLVSIPARPGAPTAGVAPAE